MTLPNPYESPQAVVTATTVAEPKQLGPLEYQNRVAWGGTLCFWGFLVMFVFGSGSRLMLVLNPTGSSQNYYYELIFWSGWFAASLQLVGLLLLCFIGEETGSKLFFKLAFGCYVADQAWILMPYLEAEATAIPPPVEFAAQLIGLASQLLIYLALRRVSHFTEDRQMLRWSGWALGLYSIVFLVGGFAEAVHRFDLQPFANIRYVGNEIDLSFIKFLSLVQGTISLPLLYCYPRLMKRLAFWWEQVPVAEVAPHASNIQSGASDESQSV